MTVQQLRKAIRELKEESAKKPNFLQSTSKEEIKKEIGELNAKIQYYCDAGIFSADNHSLNLDFDINCVDDFSTDLIQRWKSRYDLRLSEKIQLYRDIGIFNLNLMEKST